MHKGGLNMALTNDDLQAIANLMDNKLDNVQTTLEKQMDNKLNNVQATLEKQMDKKLNNVQTTLEKQMDNKLNNVQTTLENLMDNKLDNAQTTLKKQINDNSNLILGEMDRVEQRINNRFEKIDKDMQLIREDVHTTRYSNETVELLLKKVTEHEKRIGELEKTA